MGEGGGGGGQDVREVNRGVLNNNSRGLSAANVSKKADSRTALRAEADKKLQARYNRHMWCYFTVR